MIGKSTLLGQAVGAAVTGREFLGESAACGQIAIVTEEPIRLAAARLHKYGIPEEHRGAVFLVRVGTPGIEAALQRMSPALIVFDSLAAWLASVGVERFSDAGAAVLTPSTIAVSQMTPTRTLEILPAHATC